MVHFGAALSGGSLEKVGEATFLSLWPPRVLTIPFFCLVVSAASVGTGRGRDLPLLALVGSALLHGHVAQPLFVAPLGVVAYGGLAWSCRSRGPEPMPRG